MHAQAHGSACLEPLLTIYTQTGKEVVHQVAEGGVIG